MTRWDLIEQILHDMAEEDDEDEGSDETEEDEEDGDDILRRRADRGGDRPYGRDDGEGKGCASYVGGDRKEEEEEEDAPRHRKGEHLGVR